MPIIRKIIEFRTCKGIILPKSWLEYLEKETGQKITEVAIEVDDVLKIKPVIERREKSHG
jgi:antitoxin component of MazEF toxin-antitoxin module